MEKITQLEVDGMRRFIASDRTSDDLKKSFKIVLDKYKISHEIPKEVDNAEKREIEDDIDSLTALLPYSTEEEKVLIFKDIKDLETLMKYV